MSGPYYPSMPPYPFVPPFDPPGDAPPYLPPESSGSESDDGSEEGSSDDPGPRPPWYPDGWPWPPPPDEPIEVVVPPPVHTWPRLPPHHPYHLPSGYSYPNNLPLGHPGQPQVYGSEWA